MEVRNRMAELEENFNRLSENDSSVNAHFDLSNWSHCLTNETGEKLVEYTTFEEYEAAEWLLNSEMWKEEGVERY